MDDKTLDALVGSITPMQDESPYLKALIYGDEGTGKTTLAANYGDNILYIDSASGWVTLLDHPNIMEKRIERMEFKGLSQLDALVEAITIGHPKFSWIETVILDELSSMAMADLDVVLRSRAAKDPSKDPNVPTQPDYLHNTERIRRSISPFMTLPVNVIMLAHVREDKDERTGRTYTRPAFTPKMRKTITQQCHIVGRLTSDIKTVDEDGSQVYTWSLQVRPTTTVVAKTRIKDLPMVVENPDFNEMLSGWQKRLLKSELLDEEPVEELPQEIDGPITESESNVDEPSVNLGE